MPRLVTISFTGFDAPGGVPKFNRDLRAAFPDWDHVHYCWEDFLAWGKWPRGSDAWTNFQQRAEWEKARLLNSWLSRFRMLGPDDVIVADGFWADGLEVTANYLYPRMDRGPLKVVSVAHGIWSHLTKEDVDAGKEPEFPLHHAAQVAFRTRWMQLGRPIVAVSEFISEQLKLQWGWNVPVIDNGVDTDLYRPVWHGKSMGDPDERHARTNRIVVHAVNDRGNANKGWDHIQHLKARQGAYDVMSIDELADWLELPKHEAIAQADIAVHPSGYEGNSMAVAEFLSCGLPIVGYDVGFLRSIDGYDRSIGRIMPRSARSPQQTADAVEWVLSRNTFERRAMEDRCRLIAEGRLSLAIFRERWRERLVSL